MLRLGCWRAASASRRLRTSVIDAGTGSTPAHSDIRAVGSPPASSSANGAAMTVSPYQVLATARAHSPQLFHRPEPGLSGLTSIVQGSWGSVTDCAGARFRVWCLFAVCVRARGAARGARVRTGSDRAGLGLLSCRWDGSCWSGWCWQGAQPLPAGEERLLPWPVGADLQGPLAGVAGEAGGDVPDPVASLN
jgi:hypothetical protein